MKESHLPDFRIGIIGDLHTHWDDIDVMQFERSEYDLLYFTGDLGGGTPESSLRVARNMAQLRKPALVMPGNNDTGDISELAAELTYRVGLQKISAIRDGTTNTVHELTKERIRLCGYSAHQMQSGNAELSIVAGRPHSMGGPELSFPEHMRATYRIASLAESTERLITLVDETQTDNIIFFSHNGPTGLGGEPEDMWGCDFKPDGGDWGDPDLRTAIDYARSCKKNILAVIAGHMHLRTKSGAQRAWSETRDGTLYVNAARVPRIFNGDDDVYRHHVCLIVKNGEAQVSEVLLPQYGD